jgi:hypothetical protein
VTQSVLQGMNRSIYPIGNGHVDVSNSRLFYGVASGDVTCVLVTRGSTISTDGVTCP